MRITLKDQITPEGLHTNTGVRIDRLMVLAQQLREIAADEKARARFNLSQWIGDPNDADDRPSNSHYTYAVASQLHLKDGHTVDITRHCGFAACAIGWAGALPTFRKQGFRIFADGPALTPDFEGWRGFQAVTEFFGIREDDADNLFHASRYPARQIVDPLAVVERIEQLIEREVS